MNGKIGDLEGSRGQDEGQAQTSSEGYTATVLTRLRFETLGAGLGRLIF